MRTCIVGDVHGCLEELDDLVASLALRGGDRLVFAGDLVDKGPDSVGVVRRVRELVARFPGSLSVAGNHEEKSLRLHEKGREGEPWMASASSEDWAFLDSLPLVARPLPGVLVVHGGLFPAYFEAHGEIGEVPAQWRRGGGKRMERLRRVLRVRHVDAQGDMVALGDIRPEHPHWSAVYDGREGRVYFGHDPRFAPPEPIRAQHALGLDTGCVFGGKLTAAVLEDGREELVSVCARRQYAEPLGASSE